MNEKIIFINSHPIQYFAPLYKFLHSSELPIEVWYCSDITLKGGQDKEFGVKVKWDIPLIDGYPYRFFDNYAFRPSVSGSFFGLINWGIIKAMRKEKNAFFVIHGWQFFTYVLGILFAKFYGHKVALRVETPWNQEKEKKSKISSIKRFFLEKILFTFSDYFLFIGKENYLFYLNLNVAPKKLFYTPYAVDNARFLLESEILAIKRQNLRSDLKIKDAEKVILFSGKYITKKRPLELLEAYSLLKNDNVWLILMGEGELRGDIEDFVIKKNLKKVILTGFVNQGAVSEYYAIADLFVMCSGMGETWGLSVNEAMNFSLPVIVSDLTGCSSDLVKDGINGSVYQLGNIEELKDKIELWIRNPEALEKAGFNSQDIVKEFSFEKVLDTLQLIQNQKEAQY